jgi:hypothetical protein
MDFSMAMLLGKSALNTAGGLFSLAGQQDRMRMQNARLLQNANMAVRQSTFEQNRVTRQLDGVLAAQVGGFATGNLDPTSGSPAFLQLQSAAQAETDRMLIGARGVAARADAFAAMAENEAQFSDSVTGTMLNIAGDWLNTKTEWDVMKAKNSKGMMQAAGPKAGFNPFGLG